MDGSEHNPQSVHSLLLTACPKILLKLFAIAKTSDVFADAGVLKQVEAESSTKEVVSQTLPLETAEVTENPVSEGAHRRRKSWQGSGNLSTSLFADKLTRSHKHTLSADATLLNVRCGGERSLLSVVDKVKLFTVLAENVVATSSSEENSVPDSEEVVEDKGLSESPRMLSCFKLSRSFLIFHSFVS